MLREMAEAAELFSTRRALVLVLEDLHWSDRATLEWLAYVVRRRDPARLLLLGTYRPAELLGLAGGTLRPGSPADVIVVDPDVPWVLDPAELKSKCKNTPFDEARLQGRVVRTIVAGRTVYEYA